MDMSWGLLGPAVIANERRVRTLGLGAVVRRFNERTVPGIGGVWYGKQLLIAALGIQVATQARDAGIRVSNVECANAIEALACWLALKRQHHAPEARLRGSTKLPTDHHMDFKSVRRKSFYVSQPMRVGTTLALPSLGLVRADSQRFNAYELTREGEAVLNAAFSDYRPFNNELVAHLLAWVKGRDAGLTSSMLADALSPCTPMAARAGEALRARLICGAATEDVEDTQRRRAALAWVELARLEPTAWRWEACPAQITPQHWTDMQTGAKLFATRDAALRVLNALETQVSGTSNEVLSLRSTPSIQLAAAISLLRVNAKSFLEMTHVDREAESFCRECVQDSDANLLKCLVERDGRVLRLSGTDVRPGSAFRRNPTPTGQNSGTDDNQGPQPSGSDPLAWPQDISHRIQNLYLLNLDLNGELEDWLHHGETQGAAA